MSLLSSSSSRVSVQSPLRSAWFGLAVTGLFLSTSIAQAHIALDDPSPRYTDQKGGPCGKGNGNDARTGNVHTFQAGQTITIRWRETIGHVGSFRIAFDGDGADAADFDANILGSKPDPNDGTGQRELTVTLPNTPCNNCTLQLQQIMTNNANPSPNQIYHQCADMILTAPADPPADAGVADAGLDLDDAGNTNSDAGNGPIDENDAGNGSIPIDPNQNTDAGNVTPDTDAGSGNNADAGDGDGSGFSCQNSESAWGFSSLLAALSLGFSTMRKRNRRSAL